MSERQVAISDPGMADSDLIARCRAGEAAGWDALFDKYYPVAARFVFQLSADFNHEDTEEICQETFLAVVRNLASFRGKSSFQTWLLRVAANKALDFRGKSRTGKRGGSMVHFSLDGAHEQGKIDPRSQCHGPDTVLVNTGTSLINRQSHDLIVVTGRTWIVMR